MSGPTTGKAFRPKTTVRYSQPRVPSTTYFGIDKQFINKKSIRVFKIAFKLTNRKACPKEPIRTRVQKPSLSKPERTVGHFNESDKSFLIFCFFLRRTRFWVLTFSKYSDNLFFADSKFIFHFWSFSRILWKKWTFKSIFNFHSKITHYDSYYQLWRDVNRSN